MKPYFVNKALKEAAALNITGEDALKLVEVEAYPHYLDVMAILFLLNIGIMLLIGKFYPRKEAFVQEYTKQVDITPWKYVKQTGLVICIVVIGVYIYFS
jgi:SSS family solute:Na+ symporter